MLCPKCGFNSFEYNLNCPRCKRDLQAVRRLLSITWSRPSDVNFFSADGNGDTFNYGSEQSDKSENDSDSSFSSFDGPIYNPVPPTQIMTASANSVPYETFSPPQPMAPPPPPSQPLAPQPPPPPAPPTVKTAPTDLTGASAPPPRTAPPTVRMSPSAPHAIPNTRPSPPPVLTAEPDLEEPEVLLEPEIDDLDISETAAAVQAPPPKAPPTLRDTPVPNQSKIPTALTDDDIDVALDDTLGPVEVAVVAPAVARAAPSPPPSSTRPITPVGTNTPNQTVSQIRQTLEPTGDVNAAPSSLNPSETFMVPPTNLEEADLESANDLKDLPDLDSDDDTLDLGDGESLNLSDSLDDLDDE